ncbi:battenin [Anthonomus grandis grandis]|uniref:battenin n=1 Tax=Anthonomus grandis grandis TaxID=2921223 RepID=UPI002165A58B|nr:battenin [Anthonomus grandis grandis]XP_050314389.1 battenin [Anthonomus grandis grandis]XP_050314390.1 battenin [Anthonomus grandis grandis]XP_050314391.1 battenin [Anthonomus grandis grandis]
MTNYETCATDKELEPEENRRGSTIRALIAYWILGLCNNYGYVVMLTAAADIIGENADENGHSKIRENCTYMSTGAILLADIVPALIIKILAPFIPFYVHFRVVLCIVLAASGFIAVAFSESILISILGVVLTSFCSGLGEVTYLQYTSFYKKNVVSAWSSGTGGAGVIGALSYSLLQQIGMKTTLLMMLIVPVMSAVSFWIILPVPSAQDISAALEIQQKVNAEEVENPKAVLLKKLKLIPGLMKFMIPLGLVYLFEYFINQGTFEIIQIPNSVVPESSQYRWLQVTYQVGVFISRSSVNLWHIKQTWIMAILQGLNVIVFTTEAIYYYIPSFYIVVALVLWEGLLGGAAYVNTFYRITNEVEPESKQFSMAITGFADSAGISLAGLFAILAHNAICNIPMPS